MKICASIPTYNAESTVRETILSLVKQTYPFYKIRVYDNQSSDKTRDIISKLMNEFENLELIVNEVNVGAEGNFTKCIQEAEGDLSVIAHADDIYHADFARRNVEYFSEYADISAIFCAANEINESGEIIGRRYIPRDLNRNDFTKVSKQQGMSLFYKYANFVTCPSVVVRSNIYRDRIKIWDGSTFKTSADLDVWMRLLETGDFGFINEPLINYRVAQASYSYRVAKVRTEKHDIFKVLEAPKNASFAKIHRDELNFLLNKDAAVRFLNILRLKKLNQIKMYLWDCEFDLLKIIKLGLNSFWHFKMMAAILGLRIIFVISRLL